VLGSKMDPIDVLGAVGETYLDSTYGGSPHLRGVESAAWISTDGVAHEQGTQTAGFRGFTLRQESNQSLVATMYDVRFDLRNCLCFQLVRCPHNLHWQGVWLCDATYPGS
jgi:hypothetical protein